MKDLKQLIKKHNRRWDSEVMAIPYAKEQHNEQVKSLLLALREEIDGKMEEWAELEHIRWAKWQNYLHTFLVWNNEIKMWTLPHEKKEHWDRQIRTPYQMLSENEKESDREQVKPYLSDISTLITEAINSLEE